MDGLVEKKTTEEAIEGPTMTYNSRERKLTLELKGNRVDRSKVIDIIDKFLARIEKEIADHPFLL